MGFPGRTLIGGPPPGGGTLPPTSGDRSKGLRQVIDQLILEAKRSESANDVLVSTLRAKEARDGRSKRYLVKITSCIMSFKTAPNRMRTKTESRNGVQPNDART